MNTTMEKRFYNSAVWRFGKFLTDGGSGRITVSLEQTLVDSTFSGFEPLANAYTFGKKWNIALPSSLTPYLNMAEGGLDYAPLKEFKAALSAGRLMLNQSYARRLFGELTGSAGRMQQADVSEEYIHSENLDTVSEVYRTLTSVSGRFGKFTPKLGYASEYRDQQLAGQAVGNGNYNEFFHRQPDR